MSATEASATGYKALTTVCCWASLLAMLEFKWTLPYTLVLQAAISRTHAANKRHTLLLLLYVSTILAN